MSFSSRWTLLAIILFAPGRCLSNVSILDQSYDDEPLETRVGFSRHGGIAQTFTVGTGGELTRVELLLRRSGSDLSEDPFLVDIRPVIDGVPVFDPAASIRSEIQEWFELPDYSLGWVQATIPPLRVEEGQTFAIVVTPQGDQEIEWGFDRFGDYSRGGAFWTPSWNESSFEPMSIRFETWDADLAFRTYVAVPAPNTLPILVACSLFSCLRRRGLTRQSACPSTDPAGDDPSGRTAAV